MKHFSQATLLGLGGHREDVVGCWSLVLSIEQYLHYTRKPERKKKLGSERNALVRRDGFWLQGERLSHWPFGQNFR